MAKRRKRSRKSNPAYSEAVFDLANQFISALDDTSNKGYTIAKKIQIKAGNVPIAAHIQRAAEMLGDMSEELEDQIDIEN